jgi:hypothetical protein
LRDLLHTLDLRSNPQAQRFAGIERWLGAHHAKEDGAEKAEEEDFRLGFHGELDARRAPLVTDTQDGGRHGI